MSAASPTDMLMSTMCSEFERFKLSISPVSYKKMTLNLYLSKASTNTQLH